jgi:hypothetical protein
VLDKVKNDFGGKTTERWAIISIYFLQHLIFFFWNLDVYQLLIQWREKQSLRNLGKPFFSDWDRR